MASMCLRSGTPLILFSAKLIYCPRVKATVRMRTNIWRQYSYPGALSSSKIWGWGPAKDKLARKRRMDRPCSKKHSSSISAVSTNCSISWIWATKFSPSTSKYTRLWLDWSWSNTGTAHSCGIFLTICCRRERWRRGRWMRCFPSLPSCRYNPSTTRRPSKSWVWSSRRSPATGSTLRMCCAKDCF